ncbi:CAZyme family GH71 and CBM24 [Penicillium antarcticum]|uniref:CAZyme family GH71 and CBM24 n=1 Tax=Penicillium antarcticum TaxID=416450 RepID=UPI0023901B54|nr:CAZyme family GH71 and CBM24 [Penicillium antarcticum]KAJ5320666.1 CAZyme family GH71 and CBM24 [Penicillium antarcticum]
MSYRKDGSVARHGLHRASFVRFPLLAILIIAPQASAKAAFAHFMVENTERYTLADWKNDISLAHDAHIDAFALNVAHGKATNEKSVEDAFSVAESLGFKLFFSLDYAGNGAWPKSEVEMISSNDYGEYHYIGPLNDKAYVAFTTGKAPYNYVRGMPHDGWRLRLPYVIDQYKNGKASLTEESLVIWYRKQSRLTSNGGGITGNTASQLQVEYHASTVFENKIFFSAFLGSNATVEVTIDGLKFYASWESEPDGGVGIYHGSIDFNLHLFRDVSVTVVRDLAVIRVSGTPITTVCDNGLNSWNAWVESATSETLIPAVSPKLSLSDQFCIAGLGATNLARLCAFTYKYGYCPFGACYCTAIGKKALPKATGVKGYPANRDANYAGLCDFACNYGYCPKTACSTTERAVYIPTSSPFTPLACTSGEGEGKMAGLCSFAWPLYAPPEPDSIQGVPDTDDGDEYLLMKGLCNFACSREDPGDDPDKDNDDCIETATVTDEWVSCKTIDSTSTSCTTTSYHVHTGCRATPSATTTGVDACYSVNPYADQGQDGGASSKLVTTTDDRRVTTITHEKTSTTTHRPEQTHTVDGGVIRCMSDNNDYKQEDKAQFGTLTSTPLRALSASKKMLTFLPMAMATTA